jgi:hypothetical protein
MQNVDISKGHKIMFFFGAGASKDAGVSTVVELVDDFKCILKNQHDPLLLESIEEILTIIKRWKEKRNDTRDVDIEQLLEAIEKIEDRDDNVLSQFFVNNDLKLNKYLQLETKYASKKKFLSDILKRSVAISTGKNEIDIQYLQPLSDFISLYKPLHIFSTNYDICVERFCVINSKKYFDGFAHEWTGHFYDRGENILLYKLHGSITWSRSQRGKYSRNEIMVKEAIDPQTNVVTGDIEVPLILYPGKKLEYNEPSFDTLQELKQYLETDEVLYAFVVGYTFRDDHIRRLFHYAAENNPNFVLILISPSAYYTYHHQLETYKDPEFPQMSTTPSKLKERTVCLPYEFKKILPYLKDKYLQNLINGLQSKQEQKWIECLYYYSESEYLEQLEEIVEKIEITRLNISDWTSIFESAFQALLDSLYSADDEKVSKWRQIFRRVCDPITIDKYRFVPQVGDEIQFQKFGDLDVLSLTDSLKNILSKSNIKLQIIDESRSIAVKEVLNKVKLWKDYLEPWTRGMRYEQYRDLRTNDYYEEIVQLEPFLDFEHRKREFDATNGQGFGEEISQLIRQIERRELERIYQGLLI